MNNPVINELTKINPSYSNIKREASKFFKQNNKNIAFYKQLINDSQDLLINSNLSNLQSSLNFTLKESDENIVLDFNTNCQWENYLSFLIFLTLKKECIINAFPPNVNEHSYSILRRPDFAFKFNDLTLHSYDLKLALFDIIMHELIYEKTFDLVYDPYGEQIKELFGDDNVIYSDRDSEIESVIDNCCYDSLNFIVDPHNVNFSLSQNNDPSFEKNLNHYRYKKDVSFNIKKVDFYKHGVLITLGNIRLFDNLSPQFTLYLDLDFINNTIVVIFKGHESIYGYKIIYINNELVNYLNTLIKFKKFILFESVSDLDTCNLIENEIFNNFDFDYTNKSICFKHDDFSSLFLFYYNKYFYIYHAIDPSVKDNIKFKLNDCIFNFSVLDSIFSPFNGADFFEKFNLIPAFISSFSIYFDNITMLIPDFLKILNSKYSVNCLHKVDHNSEQKSVNSIDNISYASSDSDETKKFLQKYSPDMLESFLLQHKANIKKCIGNCCIDTGIKFIELSFEIVYFKCHIEYTKLKQFEDWFLAHNNCIYFKHNFASSYLKNTIHRMEKKNIISIMNIKCSSAKVYLDSLNYTHLASLIEHIKN